MSERTTRLMHCDLNWTVRGPAAAHEWAFVDPQAYFDWHREVGSNVIYCQAYLFGGTALYPSQLGPLAPGPGSQLFPKLYELGRAAGIPVWSYLCVGADLAISNHFNEWVVPGSRNVLPYGFLAPESGWMELLCARVREFLTQFPVDWLLFDWFGYGGLNPNTDLVVPAPYAAAPFRRIIGRDLPETAAAIAPDEQLRYKRAVLAEAFHRLRDAVKETSPSTRITFNVPYHTAHEPVWEDHPMLHESDGLFAECSRPEVVEWLLAAKRPEQRLMTTVLGRVEAGQCDPHTWRRWYEAGCDFFGYAWGTPPDFRPHPRYTEGLAIVRQAFREIAASEESTSP